MKLKRKEIDYILTALYYYENIFNTRIVNKIVFVFTSMIVLDGDFVYLDGDELSIVHKALVKFLNALDYVNKDAISDILKIIRKIEREFSKCVN